MDNQVLTNGSEDQTPSISDFQVNVNGKLYALGELASGPMAAQLLYIAIQQQADAAEVDKRAAVEQATEGIRKNCADLENAIQQAISEKENWKTEYQKQHQELMRVNEELFNTRLERDDAISNRDAAAAALKEAQAELAQVKGHRDDLQAQLSLGVRGAIKVMNAEEAAAAWEREREDRLAKKAAEEAAKPAIYDLHPLDLKKSRYGAHTLDGEYIEVGNLELGKFRVLQPEEVEQEIARFQAAKAAETVSADVQADTDADQALVDEPIPAPPLTVEGGTFPGNEVADVDNGSGLAETVAGVEASGETFEEEVRRRLEALEKEVFPFGV